MSQIYKSLPHVVTIGGGTGSFTLLQTFKNHFDDIVAIVNMADDGGSTGVLRDELGVLPPGDVRQCLVALSEAPDDMRALFNFRFTEGGLKGHAVGNIILSAMEKMSHDNFDDAIRLASEVLRIKGRVLPVTKDKVGLELSWPDGKVVSGEFVIGHLDFKGKTRPDMRLIPNATLNPDAAAALRVADIIVIAPGNLYGSIAPALIVPDMREALQKTEATIVYVCNLVTKPGQTEQFAVHDFANEVERFIGAPVLDYVLYNTDQPEEGVLAKYVQAGELLVGIRPAELKKAHYTAIGLPLIDRGSAHVPQHPGDAIGHTRSFIRHNAVVVAEKIRSLHVEQ